MVSTKAEGEGVTQKSEFWVSLIHLDFSDFLSWFCEAELEPQLKEQLMDIVEFEDISRSLQIFLYFLVAAKTQQGPWSWHLSHAPWGHYIVHDYWGLAVAMSSQVSKVSKSLLSLYKSEESLRFIHCIHSWKSSQHFGALTLGVWNRRLQDNQMRRWFGVLPAKVMIELYKCEWPHMRTLCENRGLLRGWPDHSWYPSW